MRVVFSGVDLQLAELLGAESVVRQHPLDGPADDLLGPSFQQVTQGLLLEALGIAAVAAVELALELVARHRDSRGVQHDDVIPRVEARLVGWLVLALEDARDARGKAAERLVRRVDDVPASLDLARADRVGLRAHRSSVVSVCHFRLLTPPEGDAPEAEPASRGRNPVASRRP